MIYLLAGIFGGVFITFSSNLNAKLVEREGLYRGSFYNYFIASIVSGILILSLGISFPKVVYFDYRLLGGLVGVSVLMLTSYILPKLPMMYATVLIFVGQLATGFVIDFIQGRGVTSLKIMGAALILFGMLYNISLDRKTAIADSKALESL